MQQPLSWLAQMGHQIRYFHQGWFMEISDERTQLLRWADVIMVSRLFHPDAINTLRAYNPKAVIVYDLDDDFFNLPPENMTSKSMGGREIENMAVCLSMADLVTCSTRRLASVLSEFNPQVKVIKNAIDPLLLDWPILEPDHPRVGWAGSVTHLIDVEPFCQGLGMALDRERGWDPAFMGHLGAPMIQKLNRSKAFFQPPVIFSQYYKKLHGLGLSIGAAPVQDNIFNASKSNVKWMEYSALGAAVVASDVGPYRDTIRHGVNGLLVKHHVPYEWRDALLELMKDEKLRRHLVENARQDLRQKYHPEHWARNLGRYMEKALARKRESFQVLAAGRVKKPLVVIGMLNWVPEPDGRFFDVIECVPRILGRAFASRNFRIKVKILDQGSCPEATEWILNEGRYWKDLGYDLSVETTYWNRGVPAINRLFFSEPEADFYLKCDNDVNPPPGFVDLLAGSYLELEKAKINLGLLSLDVQWGPETFATRKNGELVERTIETTLGHRVFMGKGNTCAVGMCRIEKAWKLREAGGHPEDRLYGTDQPLTNRFFELGYSNAHLLPMIERRPGTEPVPWPLVHKGSSSDEVKTMKRTELTRGHDAPAPPPRVEPSTTISSPPNEAAG